MSSSIVHGKPTYWQVGLHSHLHVGFKTNTGTLKESSDQQKQHMCTLSSTFVATSRKQRSLTKECGEMQASTDIDTDHM